MPDDDLWQRLRREVADGEQRLVGAVQHAQSEPSLRTEYAWCTSGSPDDGVPVLGPPAMLRRFARDQGGAVFIREVTEWRPL